MFRAIQSHSNCIPDPDLMVWVEINHKQIPWLYHDCDKSVWPEIAKRGVASTEVSGRAFNMWSCVDTSLVPHPRRVWKRGPEGGWVHTQGYFHKRYAIVRLDVEAAYLLGVRFWQTQSCACVSNKNPGPDVIPAIKVRLT